MESQCIPQDNPQDKHRIINQMDQVYANAFATIIAAAGENAQMGLPGVSISPRQPQQRVDIEKATLLELPYGEDDLLSSKWASRGWTYQEGYLSRRRIIFTASQVLFLCNNHYLEEYAHRLLKGQGDPLSRWLDKLNSIFPTFSQTGALSTSSLLRQVEEYSLRELSYSSDSLNAFRGILNYYTTVHFTGVRPIMHLGWGLIAEQAKSGQGLIVHLDWYHRAAAKRRHEFPSWAWTGWGGPLDFGKGILVHMKDAKHSYPQPDFTWEVSVDAEGENTLDMCDFASICLRNSRVANSGLEPRFVESSPRRLSITCRALPIHFVKVNLIDLQLDGWTEIKLKNTERVVMIRRPYLKGIYHADLAVLELWNGIYVGASHYLDRKLEQQDSIIGLLFLSVDVLYDVVTQLGCLLVRQLDNGFYERVGLVPDMLPNHWERTSLRMIFLDDMGRVLDRIEGPERLTQQLLEGLGERKTICLL